jgi:hypothetical protein
LIGYYISCIQQEDSFEELLQRSLQGARYVFSNANTDNLFVNPEEGIRVNNKIAGILDAARLRGDALFYSYPVVLVHESTSNQNRRKLGCLLTIELGEIPRAREPSPEILYPKTDDPFFHPTLLARLGIKSEQQL